MSDIWILFIIRITTTSDQIGPKQMKITCFIVTYISSGHNGF